MKSQSCRNPDAARPGVISPAGRVALVLLVGLVLPACVLLSIWMPVWQKYWTSRPEFSPAVLQRLRIEPSDAVLEEIGRQKIAVPLHLDTPDALRHASQAILSGRLELPHYPTAALSSPFRLADLEQDGETLGLHLGSLSEIGLLLDAYALDPRRELLAAAVKRYVEFCRAERQAWIPHGFLWNDHAIASRISLSARLWRLVRKDPNFGTEVAAELPLHVWRSVQLLASPLQYTYATNHGVMQNVALLQAAAAFPGLPDVQTLAQLAVVRLEAQLGHYQSPDGMILEHSAHYHQLGVELITFALRAATLAGLEPPESWSERARRGRYVLALLRRPDGSLPRFGNTFGDYESPPLHSKASEDEAADGLHILPVAGYGVWRSHLSACGKSGTHLTLAASRFPGHGHKLADDGSVMLWAGGQGWIDNTGYWPFGLPGRSAVDGWRGGNAPHLQSEAAIDAGPPFLSHMQLVDDLLFMQVERSARHGKTTVRRQVLGLADRAWLIVDDTPGSDETLETLWTFPPPLELPDSSTSTASLYLTAPAGQCGMDVSLLPKATIERRILKGQQEPFGGWMMIKGAPTPAVALEITKPPHLKAAPILFSIRNPDTKAASLEAFESLAPEHWQARIAMPGGASVEVVREGPRLSVKQNAGEQTVTLVRLPRQDEAWHSIANSLDVLARKYPAVRDLLPWRERMSKRLITLVPAILTAMALIAFHRPRMLIRASILIGVSVLGAALWLHLVYFA